MGMAAYKNKDTDIDRHALECADKAQTESLEERIEFIKKAKTYSDCKNIILSGGYHLNCANNFKLVKLFPELNFFVDPIAHDGGTAVGAAYATYQYEKDFKN
jgi:carbamoyltransferase